MEDLSRNTDEVIMQIHNLFRYTDPIFRLTTIGTVKLIQSLARMAKEKQISRIEVEDFAGFLKATDGKYDIMNIPAVDKDTSVQEMDNLGVCFSIMPDLDKDDGLMQVAVYQPDREKFVSWYERFLISRMQGGEKELKELRGLTRGNVSIIYGHNLKNGEMFGHLKKLYDIDYNSEADYKKHPKVWIITPDGAYEYSIFAFREINVRKDRDVYTVELPDAKDRRRFLYGQIEKSQKDTGIRPSEDGRVITLSTCTSRTEDGRFVVQAVNDEN